MPADPADRLAEHARTRHEQTLQRARAALAAMTRNGEPVTIARLATQASVSRSWIYTQPELRDQVEQAQQHAARPSAPGRQASSRASEDSLRRRLELAHQRISQLRAEKDQLRQDLAIAHGHLRAGTSARDGTRS